MEFKGTKGDWNITGNFELQDVFCKQIKDENGIVLFDINTLLDGENNEEKIKESKANAVLVKNAPKLLFAVKELVRVLEMTSNRPAVKGIVSNYKNLIKEATTI